ncbi:MAG: type II toxin-antitoxin system VapC family toxin [Deltaproteobacteria bacterium]|nr:type II toxin-antitoxin system VapC family toxin [Deltaproteobacteria bacterium]
MKSVFVDTAGWMMMADSADRRHEKASAFRDRFLSRRGLLITTDYVVDETLTLLRMRIGLEAAQKWWWMVSGSNRLDIELVDPHRTDLAREWFFGWSDQRFSFTDCTSFVVMRDLGISRALTSDAHFRTAGFETVP